MFRMRSTALVSRYGGHLRNFQGPIVTNLGYETNLMVAMRSFIQNDYALMRSSLTCGDRKLVYPYPESVADLAKEGKKWELNTGDGATFEVDFF